MSWRRTRSAICCRDCSSKGRARSTIKFAGCGSMSTDTPATYANPNMQEIVGSHDVVLITFDTLRFDVAQEEFAAGRLPHLARYLAPGGWEERYTPGSFTYAAHCAFFA